MKVLVDTTYIMLHRMHKSLTIYIFRFLDAIPAEERAAYTLLVLEETESFFRQHYPDFSLISYNPYAHDVNNRILKYIKRSLMYRKIVNGSGCDVIFVPNDLMMFTAVKTKLKKVVVVHDMKSISNQVKGSMTQKVTTFYYWLLLHFADKIIAISNYTRKDVHRYFPSLRPEKIDVVYNSVVVPQTIGEHIPEELVKGKYILFVNTLKPYKNAMTLMKAFTLVKDKIDHQLVFVGKDTDYWRQMADYAKEHRFEDRVHRYGNVSDELLYSLYKNASLFVTTSLKEGFGYTPIEAAMCGCPVISSTCEALSDTTLGLLNYYDPPTDENQLAQQLMHVLSTPSTEEDLAKVAGLFKRKYAPDSQYHSIVEVLQSTLR